VTLIILFTISSFDKRFRVADIPLANAPGPPRSQCGVANAYLPRSLIGTKLRQFLL
jgi:hypothetical protein